LQHIDIILSTDGDAPSPVLINHAQFLIRRNQRCRLVHCPHVCFHQYKLHVRLTGITNRQIAIKQ